MISIIIDGLKVKEFAKKIDTSKGSYKSISSKLQRWINNEIISNPHNPDIKVAREIKKSLKTILTARPKGLEVIITDFRDKGFQVRIFNPALGRNGELTNFGKEIFKIFNYKSFRQSKKAIWFSNSLNIKSCTICNTQYTLKTSQVSGEKLLFHLDHYFPKSVYPYLCLSYYNLIPCCVSCNMSKSNKPFTLQENIHPYIENFHDIAKFNIDKASLLDYLIDPINNERKINYKVEVRAKYFGDKIFEKKLENYLREFRVEEQYMQFKDIAAETFLKAKFYEKSRRNELKRFFMGSNILINDELIKRFILGNYYQDKDLLKRPLAKFMKDIGEDLNLL